MPDPNSADFWNAIYRQNLTVWDLGGASPVFIQLVEDRAFPPGKMIVLGAGKGHDARLFARHGFDVTAVDFAEEAIRELEQLARPNEPVRALQADFFDLPEELHGAFDYALEYATYCSFTPSLRRDYARTVHQVLRPQGLFVGLVFPLWDRPGGPPFAVSTDQLEGDLRELGFTRKDRRFPEESGRRRAGMEELLIMEK